MKPYADNVIIVLEPLPKQTSSGLHLPDRKVDRREARLARVVAAGPGAWVRINRREALETNGLAEEQYKFVPTSVRPGDRVLVDSIAGQDYTLDIDVPRHNKGADFEELAGERGEFRIVREAEIHGVVES